MCTILMKILNKYSSALLGAATCVGIANAASISLNFAENGNSTISDPNTSVGRTGYEATNWNNTPSGGVASGLIEDLNDSNGMATTTDVEWSAGGAWGDGTANTDAGAGNGAAQLLRGYLDDSTPGGVPTDIVITITNIPYTSYDIVVYHSSDDGGTGNWRTVTLTGGITGNASGPIDQWNDDQDLDHRSVVFTDLSGSSMTITAAGRNGGNRGSIAGIQIVDTSVVPEPSSAALIGMAAIGFTLRRRR